MVHMITDNKKIKCGLQEIALLTYYPAALSTLPRQEITPETLYVL